MTLHLIGAMAVGGVIGLERSYHGRPAGFRTHTLVCLASSLLMLVTLYQAKWLPAGASMEAFRTDPTRMAQGIMTGIGFLGAGVIFKEGLSVRGLTTAASIWITSALGVLIGIGFYFPAIVATILTVGVLSLFRVIEARIPSHHYAQHFLSFGRNDAMEEEEVRSMLQAHGFTIANISYRVSDSGDDFEYRMVIRTSGSDKFASLARFLRAHSRIKTFRISPTGD
ncbi:MgtC/SapB family protein [Rhodoferax sp. GW822-FHT02A01]|uniref:MgtC/SapB family protein n=1 Tax=Rhodoferax sp. GW822-FHT02A01 TaxID=3141537 RepID=UPI00315D92D8